MAKVEMERGEKSDRNGEPFYILHYNSTKALTLTSKSKQEYDQTGTSNQFFLQRSNLAWSLNLFVIVWADFSPNYLLSSDFSAYV